MHAKPPHFRVFPQSSTLFCARCVWKGWEVPGSAWGKSLLHSLQHQPRDLGFISLSPPWFSLHIALTVNYPSHERLRGVLRQSL